MPSPRYERFNFFVYCPESARWFDATTRVYLDNINDCDGFATWNEAREAAQGNDYILQMTGAR